MHSLLNFKIKGMKKIFSVLAIAALMTACNNSSEEKTVVSKDSVNAESPLMDAVNTADSAGKVIEAAKDSGIKIIEETDLILISNAVGIYFKEQLELVLNNHKDKVKEVRARGLMLALEFKDDFEGKKISDALFEAGNVIGFKLNTLRFLPPLTIKTNDIDKMIDKLKDYLPQSVILAKAV